MNQWMSVTVAGINRAAINAYLCCTYVICKSIWSKWNGVANFKLTVQLKTHTNAHMWSRFSLKLDFTAHSKRFLRIDSKVNGAKGLWKRFYQTVSKSAQSLKIWKFRNCRPLISLFPHVQCTPNLGMIDCENNGFSYKSFLWSVYLCREEWIQFDSTSFVVNLVQINAKTTHNHSIT